MPPLAPQAPCEWTLDPAVCDGAWADYPQDVKDFATSMASAVMWASTGRQFGLCDITVRPCGKWEGNNWLWGDWAFGFYGQGWNWDTGSWPFGWWGGCGCGVGLNGWCGCVPSNQIWLPGPVYAITSVTMDGTVVDPTTYRVDGQNWLVRTSPNPSTTVNTWPWEQNFNYNSGTGTLMVDYQRGTPIPSAVGYAAGLLASQYAKACQNIACMLPARVVSVVRQNVSIHAVDADTLLEKGLTGVAMVDQIIAAYNPYGLKGRLRLLSPDQPQYAQTTWTTGP